MYFRIQILVTTRQNSPTWFSAFQILIDGGDQFRRVLQSNGCLGKAIGFLKTFRPAHKKRRRLQWAWKQKIQTHIKLKKLMSINGPFMAQSVKSPSSWPALTDISQR
ncbi:hypothetical protein HS088_TW11G00087 [Tripterygium wilfordii]|uniref:Uncharacterized protein n=1 Tax=Tripterygium wilfordii TaxID=458696 RepID=A0A7J7D118_TRIWF|nr:hypothetical protein HS088_TW11G00087 [Tripterygium wilfordii]